MAELLAGLAAVGFAAALVAIKRGLVDNTVVVGVLLSLSASWVVTLLATLTSLPTGLTVAAVVLFALSGLTAPGISRYASTAGIDRLGPSTAAPILAGVRPVLSMIGGVVLLSESVGWLQVAGVALITLGVVRLSQAPDEEEVAHSPERQHDPSEHHLPGAASLETTSLRVRTWTRRIRPAVAWPLLAGACYSASDLLVKAGTNRVAEPVFAGFVATSVALALWIGMVVVVRPMRAEVRLGRGAGFLLLSGAFAALAVVALFHAIERGEVSVVGPIVATSPLAVLLFSRVFIRDLEHIHTATVVAAVAVVAGAVMLSLG